MADERMLVTAAELAKALTPGDLDETLQRITDAAVELLPDVQMASITIRHRDGSLETAAPTDALLCEIDAYQYDMREGPCYHAATNEPHVISTNLAEAVRTRTTIGQAVGIVMERYQLTDERAFAFLTRLSQHRNVKLRLVAQEIVAASEHRGDED